MKILLVSPFTSASGSAVRFWNIAQQLRDRGHGIVYVERAPKGAPRPSFNEITYYQTPTLGNIFLDIAYSLVHNLAILIRHIDLNVYYALKPAPNNCLPAMVAKACGKRICLDVDDLDYGYFPPGIKQRISRFFFDMFPRCFDIVTYHTDQLGQYLIKAGAVPKNRLLSLPQGLSEVFERYDIDRKPKRLPRTLLYCATLGITSDLGKLLPAFASLCRAYPDLNIRIVGDGVRRKAFQDSVTELGIARNVHFLGRISHSDLPATMAANWIGINYLEPTFTNSCRAILKIREYLAVGLQVVCNHGGETALFEDFVHVEESIDAMTSRLLILLRQQPEVNRTGRAFVVDTFRWSRLMRPVAESIEKGSLEGVG